MTVRALDQARDHAAPLLALHGVRRTYLMGDQTVAALDGIDLTIEAGEFVAIVGPSGSGKSTLLNVLGCLDQPTGGSYRVAGQDTTVLDSDALAALRRHTFGFVFQGYNLLPRLSAGANVEAPAVFAGVRRAPRRARAETLLARLGLGDRLDHRPTQLSGGQQQRVGIARALMNGGTVILADEPTGALDSTTGAEMLALFRTLRDEGHTILIVTHDLHVAAQADRIVEIGDGRILADRVINVRARAPAARAARQVEQMGRFQQCGEALRGAVRTFGGNRLRNVLTMLGIVVGIAAVILSVAIGEGSQKRVLREIEGLGNDIAHVYAGGGFSATSTRQIETLNLADMTRLAALPFLEGATPMPSKQLTLRFGGRASQAKVYGVSETFFRVENMPMIEGRSFAPVAVKGSDPLVVIDEQSEQDLFVAGERPLGSIVLVGDMPARIVGVARPLRHSEFGYGGNFAAIPFTTYVNRVSGPSFFPELILKIDDTFDRKVAIAALNKLFRSWHGRDDFFIYDVEETREAVIRSKSILSFTTASVAFITLLVGGIGVMNMMLVAVAERTREIGILMAIGARRTDIMLRFLIEAVLLCVGGGALGTLLALGIGKLLVVFQVPVGYEFSWRAVVVAIVTSTAAGLGAGVLPARRAARINPVEALAR